MPVVVAAVDDSALQEILLLLNQKNARYAVAKEKEDCTKFWEEMKEKHRGLDSSQTPTAPVAPVILLATAKVEEQKKNSHPLVWDDSMPPETPTAPSAEDSPTEKQLMGQKKVSHGLLEDVIPTSDRLHAERLPESNLHLAPTSATPTDGHVAAAKNQPKENKISNVVLSEEAEDSPHFVSMRPETPTAPSAADSPAVQQPQEHKNSNVVLADEEEDVVNVVSRLHTEGQPETIEPRSAADIPMAAAKHQLEASRFQDGEPSTPGQLPGGHVEPSSRPRPRPKKPLLESPHLKGFLQLSPSSKQRLRQTSNEVNRPSDTSSHGSASTSGADLAPTAAPPLTDVEQEKIPRDTLKTSLNRSSPPQSSPLLVDDKKGDAVKDQPSAVGNDDVRPGHRRHGSRLSGGVDDMPKLKHFKIEPLDDEAAYVCLSDEDRRQNSELFMARNSALVDRTLEDMAGSKKLDSLPEGVLFDCLKNLNREGITFVEGLTQRITVDESVKLINCTSTTLLDMPSLDFPTKGSLLFLAMRTLANILEDRFMPFNKSGGTTSSVVHEQSNTTYIRVATVHGRIRGLNRVVFYQETPAESFPVLYQYSFSGTLPDWATKEKQKPDDEDHTDDNAHPSRANA